jgi:hypothetical protein
LTARFILHLREWDAEQVGEKSRATDISVVEFQAASRSAIISSFVAADDFGVDPVGQTIGIQEELHAAKHLHSASDMASTSVLETTGDENQRYQDAV